MNECWNKQRWIHLTKVIKELLSSHIMPKDAKDERKKKEETVFNDDYPTNSKFDDRVCEKKRMFRQAEQLTARNEFFSTASLNW